MLSEISGVSVDADCAIVCQSSSVISGSAGSVSSLSLQRLLDELAARILLDRAHVGDGDREEAIEMHRIADFGDRDRIRPTGR